MLQLNCFTFCLFLTLKVWWILSLIDLIDIISQENARFNCKSYQTLCTSKTHMSFLLFYGRQGTQYFTTYASSLHFYLAKNVKQQYRRVTQYIMAGVFIFSYCLITDYVFVFQPNTFLPKLCILPNKNPTIVGSASILDGAVERSRLDEGKEYD